MDKKELDELRKFGYKDAVYCGLWQKRYWKSLQSTWCAFAEREMDIFNGYCDICLQECHDKGKK